MRRILLTSLSATLSLVVLFGGHRRSSNDLISSSTFTTASQTGKPPVAVCFAPGTPDEYMAEWQRRIWQAYPIDFQIGDRWNHTATNQNTGSQGDGCTLTYSFVPDGVMIDGQPSQLFARMDELFNGNEQLWQSKFAEVFARWAELSGLRYQLVSDDGAPFGQNSPGLLGARGDVRIGSIPIDGPSNVLAYDFFPDIGDMVLDAAESWGSPAQNYIFLRNIVAHEHGHGWGLAHVCPTNGTKLLEPYYTSAFNGPQHDDIRAVQRNYGDHWEPNDDAATATPLGTLSTDYTLSDVSLDDNSDTDFYKFAVPAGKGFTLELSPVGMSYLDGPQNDDGSCTPGTLINSLDDQNLDLYLRNSSGSTILAQSATHPNGEIERIYRYQAPAQGDSFIVEISGATANAVQLYQLAIQIFNLADPYFSVSPLDFDTTQIDVPVTRLTTVINNSGQSLTLNSITTTGPFSVSPTGPQTIPPQGDLELTLVYDAQTLGEQTGVLTVTHNGPGGALECPLIGMAVTSSIQFLNGTHIDFGNVPVNTTDSTAVVIRAQGNIPTGILNITVTDPFSIIIGLPILLNPTQSLILRPRVTPTQLGDVNGIMIIEHTAPSSPDTVYLHAVGTPNLNVPVDPSDLPTAYRLEQNYPNPFNPTTTITFDVPRASTVRLAVYSITGRLVSELVNGDLAAGHYTTPFDGSALPSGMYLYRLTTPEFSALGKMMLLK
jgi:hypothetical protein